MFWQIHFSFLKYYMVSFNICLPVVIISTCVFKFVLTSFISFLIRVTTIPYIWNIIFWAAVFGGNLFLQIFSLAAHVGVDCMTVSCEFIIFAWLTLICSFTFVATNEALSSHAFTDVGFRHLWVVWVRLRLRSPDQMLILAFAFGRSTFPLVGPSLLWFGHTDFCLCLFRGA